MFNISFLNGSVLIASLAALIPLLIYLFAKKRPPKIVFSSIRFIQMSQKKQKKKFNLTNLLLLIIRMLIILLTVMAIARPAVKLESLRSKTKHPPTAVAVIIDNSYSMEYVVDTQTLLEKATGKAEEVQKMLTSDDVSCVFTLDRNWNSLNSSLSYGAFRPELLRSVQPVNQVNDLSEIIEDAERILLESHLPNREIYFITDLQKYEIPDELSTPLFVIPAAELESRGNLAIEQAGLAPNFIDKGNEKQIDFTVVNYGNSSVDDVICSLFLDGKTVAEKVTDLEKRERQNISFVVPVEKAGWHQGSITVRDERLLYDNQYHFCFYYDASPRIAVVTSQKELSTSLKTVLSIYTGDISSVDLISNDLTLESLSTYSNIIVWKYQDWDTRSNFIFTNLKANGRQVLYLTDEESPLAYKDFLQEEFNLRFNEFLSVEESLKLTSVNSYHPVAAELADNRPAEIRELWKTDAQAGIVLLAEKQPLVVEKDGSILWLFDVSSLRFPFLVDANFPILAYNSLSYTAAIGEEKQYTVGALIHPEDDLIYMPDGERLQTGGRKIILKETGFYREGSQRSPIAVNLNYEESDYQPMEQIDQPQLIWCDKDWAQTIFEARYGFELWKYFLIAVLILFMLEMFIIKREEKKAN